MGRQGRPTAPGDHGAPPVARALWELRAWVDRDGRALRWPLTGGPFAAPSVQRQPQDSEGSSEGGCGHRGTLPAHEVQHHP